MVQYGMAVQRFSDNLIIKFIMFIVVLTIASILLLASLMLHSLYEERESALRDEAWNRLILMSDFITETRSFTEGLVNELYRNNALMADLKALLGGSIHDYLIGQIGRYSPSIGEAAPNINEYMNGILSKKGELVAVVARSATQDVRLTADERGFSYGRNDDETAATEYRNERFEVRKLSGGATVPAFSVSLQIRDEQTMSPIGSLTCVFRMDALVERDFAVTLRERGETVWQSPGQNTAGKNDGKTRISLSVFPNKSISVDYPGVSAVEFWKHMRAKPILILAIAGLGVFVIIALAVTIISLFLRRIHRLSVGMKEVENGNLAVRIPAGNLGDELSEVTRCFNLMCERLNEYIERSYRSEIKRRQAELAALQAQINPHFLYNTLEAIRMKAVASGADDAAVMIFSLAGLLRYGANPDPVSTIEEEFGHCRLYLELFRIRYKNRFRSTQEIGEGAGDVALPRVLLQPIVENYLLHGFSKENPDNRISMTAKIEGEDAVIEIQDNGAGISEIELRRISERLESDEQPTPGASIGLANVRQRLGCFFSGKERVSIDSRPGSGTTVTIRIPKEADHVPSIVG